LLFVLQRRNRIDARRAPRGNEARHPTEWYARSGLLAPPTRIAGIRKSTARSLMSAVRPLVLNVSGNEFVVQELPLAKGQTLRVLTNWEKRLSK
jgi:hypothetical protein